MKSFVKGKRKKNAHHDDEWVCIILNEGNVQKNTTEKRKDTKKNV